MPVVAELVERVVMRYSIRAGERWYVEEPVFSAEQDVDLVEGGTKADAAAALRRWRTTDIRLESERFLARVFARAKSPRSRG